MYFYSYFSAELKNRDKPLYILPFYSSNYQILVSHSGIFYSQRVLFNVVIYCGGALEVTLELLHLILVHK
jgi:hypothetical protein